MTSILPSNSIRIRIFVLPLLMLVLLAGLVVYNSNQIIKSAMMENVKASVEQTSKIIGITIAPYAATGNLGEIAVYLSEVLLEKRSIGLSYIVVAREEDDIALLQVGSVGNELPPADDLASIDKAVYRGIIHIRQPLLLAGNKVGYLQYGLVSELLLLASGKVGRDGALLVFFGSIISGALLLILGWRLTLRINAVVEASEAISHGNYDRRVNAQGKDEIATLAGNFNLMASAIQLRILEITDLNVTLEERVVQRTRELESSNHKLQETIWHLEETRHSLTRSEKLASLGALVAGIAHELNTPVGNALTVASALEAKVLQVNEEYSSGALRKCTLDNHIESTRHACNLIVRNLARADELVSSFKRVAVDQTSAKKRSFDLREVVHEVVATLLPSIRKLPYEIRVDIPAGIGMDSYPGPLGQIITNLINNATTHAFEERAGGWIQLTATQDRERGQVILCCLDNGEGISPENLPRIFDPFFTTRLGRGGSGLGLNIVHHIVESVLRGTIEVQSELGKGTCFTLTLPMVADRSEAKCDQSALDAFTTDSSGVAMPPLRL